ncbi:undecaprenyldiphospho-muramoylpentapeptide beta-N-acetylglucosaminyltransferase [Maribacter sp. 2307ULW6-5]|uniref:undecaprenyldiphospho-muramoylpentapeptide beta-N-acetylglucosaminyltransferase n=1 Tax=Maribacter sp. 2307ULW6-5 TaxID=3386275 RepID=UPI0039BD081A
MGSYRFILSGGGTGGHIYPALAIANELKRRHPDAKFLFVGAKDRMEMEKVPQAGYEIKGLWIRGLQRKLTLKNMMFPIKLMHSLYNAGRILSRFKPHLVVGTGGFASGPLLYRASAKGLPCVLQEQNSFAGITNKLLKDKVKKIFVAYDGMERFFPADKLVKTGNPVRADLLDLNMDQGPAQEFFGLEPGKTTLLVLGGSLGAKSVNELVAQKLGYFDRKGLQLLWQCGKGYISQYADKESKTVKVHAFLNRMDMAYAAADLIVSRAGAGAVSELCLVGKPVVFIPSPWVAEDHQTKNAEAMVAHNAAVMIKESQLQADFEKELGHLLVSKERREELSRNCRAQALPRATAHICDEIEKILTA